ncbi:glycosyltransferase, partial [Candidatus Woesearchaeota archaeon]|nr:glycosyltransferase [Candidatus Woesearchaeota archaeon]
MPRIEDYRKIVGSEVVGKLQAKAESLKHLHIIHINSTYQGGGVAELLSSLVPLLNSLGIVTGWRILRGNPDFFGITKKFHNALQGDLINFTSIKKKVYIQSNEEFSIYTHIVHDLVFIHDPQPLPLISFYKKEQPWIWRCHVDLSNPNRKVWNFLKQFIEKYDLMIISNKDYYRKDLNLPQKVIHPAIDPLTAKNKPIPKSLIYKTLDKYGIPLDKPLITQISRFDKWKDPLGVLRIFKKVRRKVKARLVLCGSMAMDDPEGWLIYEQVKRKARKLLRDKEVFLITSENNILVNALQRVSAVIVQKSLREGFGLSVTEALWKGKPVVATNGGGIKLQIKDGFNGFLVPVDNERLFAKRVLQLLTDEKLALKLGLNAKRVVKQHFLITRLLEDHLDVIRVMSKA